MTVTKNWIGDGSDTSKRPATVDDFVSKLVVKKAGSTQALPLSTNQNDAKVLAGTAYYVSVTGATSGTVCDSTNKDLSTALKNDAAWTIKIAGLPDSGSYSVTESSVAGYKTTYSN